MTDLTKIEKPFGLLDAETQEALRAHGGPWQYWFPEDGWRDFKGQEPAWDSGTVYRVKQQPPKPREWWLVGDVAYSDKATAQTVKAGTPPDWQLVHVREVLPE